MLVVKEKDAERASKFCAGKNLAFAVKSGPRYLGGFAGEKELEAFWIKDKIEAREDAACSASKLAPHVPQSAFTGLRGSSQHEWTFPQRVAS